MTSASSPRFLSGAEVRAQSVGNLYELVERLRPLWLRSGGARLRSARLRSEIMVVLNQAYFGPALSLRDLTPEHVRSIEYMDGSLAAARFSYPGVQPHIVGAIVVEMGYQADAEAANGSGQR